MFSKIFIKLVVCVCALAGLTAGIPPLVAYEQSGDNGVITLTRGGDRGVNASSLNATCQDSGQVELSFITVNNATTTMTVGGTKTQPPTDTNCTKILELGVKTQTLLTTGDSCGRTATATSYEWFVEIEEVVQISGEELLSENFITTNTISCKLQPKPSNERDIDVYPTVRFEGNASYIQAIQFNLTKVDTLVNEKWQFQLVPATLLPSLNYKIVSCQAKPLGTLAKPITDDSKVDIIRDSCIRDTGTTVDVGTSPGDQKQIITVSPFRFSKHIDAIVALTCTVKLCKDTDVIPNCAVIPKTPNCPPRLTS